MPPYPRVSALAPTPVCSTPDLVPSFCFLDVIDLTNDGDPDEDLRRAMAASLQDHQSQQAYRPPAAPSSTVGVSCTTGSSSAQHAIAQLRSCPALADSRQIYSDTHRLGRVGAEAFAFQSDTTRASMLSSIEIASHLSRALHAAMQSVTAEMTTTCAMIRSTTKPASQKSR